VEKELVVRQCDKEVVAGERGSLGLWWRKRVRRRG